MKGYMITNSDHEDNVLITVSSYGETVYVGPARPYELPTEEEIVDIFQIHASEQMFSHQLMTQNDFKEAITNLLKGEKR